MSLLSIRDLGKSYGPTTALTGVTLDVAPGSRTAVVGPSGSGKTTLLRLIAGFEVPDSGEIRLDGEPLADSRSGVAPHRRNIGLVMQEGALFPHLSILDNICFGIRHDADRSSRALALLDLVELPRSVAERQPHQLSGGQQQRVALARALARQPRLMLLDEPFSALDAGLREQMRDATAQILAAAAVATVLVTHDRDEAMSFADQLVILRDGRLQQAGPPRLLYRAPVDRTTALFLGPAIILPAQFGGRSASCALGRLPLAGEEHRTGTGEVMIRPEQLRMEAAGADGSWIVQKVEDRGNRYALVLRPAEGNAPEIALDVAGEEPLGQGTRAEVRVDGTVHPLAG